MADKYNVTLPDGTTITVPAWAAEDTLNEIKARLGTNINNQNAMIKALVDINFSADEVDDAYEEAADIINETTERQGKLLQDTVETTGKAVRDLVNNLDDTDKPLSKLWSMVSGAGDAVKAGGDKMKKSYKPLAELMESVGGLIPGMESVAGAAGAVIGWNIAKVEQFADAQKQMINSGAVILEAGTTFNDLYKRSLDVGIAYSDFVGVIGTHGTVMNMFGNSVGEGSSRFLSMFSKISVSMDELGDLGMSHQDMMSALADELEVMRVSGRVNRNTVNAQEKVEESFKNLMLEQTALAALTGRSRSELLAARQAIMTDPRIGQVIRTLEEQGNTKQVGIIEDIVKQFTLLNPVLEEAGSSVGDEITNAFVTELSNTRDNIKAFDIRNTMDQKTQAMLDELGLTNIIDGINTAVRTGELDESHNFLINALSNMSDKVYIDTNQGGAFMSEVVKLQGAGNLINLNFAKLANITREDFEKFVKDQQDKMAATGEGTVAMNNLGIAVKQVQDAFTVNLDTATAGMNTLSEVLKEGATTINKFFDQLGIMDSISADSIAARMEAGTATTDDQIQMLYYVMNQENNQLISEGGLGAAYGYFAKTINMVAKPLEHMMPLSVSGRDSGGFLSYGNEELLQKYQELNARRTGGQVTGGQSYIVGESGPEVFTASQNGTILDSLDAGGHGDYGNAASPSSANISLSANVVQQSPTIDVNMTQGQDQLAKELENIRQIKINSVQSMKALEKTVNDFIRDKDRNRANKAANG